MAGLRSVQLLGRLALSLGLLISAPALLPAAQAAEEPVSYTHLTLPTILRV